MLRKLTSVAIVSSLTLVASCGDRASIDPRPTKTTTPRAEGTKTRQEKRIGGTLRIPLSGVRILDPARSTSISENLVIQQLFQGLVRFDSRLRVVPDLADSWSLSEDRCLYTFFLDETAKFHHGRAVTASDVVFSLTRLLEPRLRSVARSYLRDVLDGEDSIASPSPSQVTIRLREPDHVFIRFLAMQHPKIVPADLAEGAEFSRHPVGSGPFRFQSWTEEDVVLSAASEGPRTSPYLDRIVFSDLIRDEEREAFIAGEVDYLVASPDESEQLSGSSTGFQVSRMPTLSLHYLGMNLSRPPFDDLRVRQAVAFALDRESFDHKTQGRVQRAAAILPPGMPGYDPDRDAYPMNRDRALSLLREAGYGPDGKPFPEIVLFSGRIPEQVEVIRIVRENLAAVGIPVIARETDDYQEYLRDLPQCDLALFGWIADYPDPDNFFSNLFRSSAELNFMHYTNPEVDALIEEGRAGEKKLDRVRLYQKTESLVLADCPVVPLFHDSALHCVQDRVRDLSVNALGIYYTRFDRVWIRNSEETESKSSTLLAEASQVR